MQRDTEQVIGNSIALSEALDQASALAQVNRSVLVMGERGTGKELVGERIHFLSQRWDGPLLKVNCAAIAEQLLESELFGHEPGAFTGATAVHRGRFERADGGTLFLDELGNMSLGLQEKLLRVIEYGDFERLGGQSTLQVDVRVVAATNADLKQLAREGKFREDLLDRISFDVVHLPPLRHRLSDVPELAYHFAVQMSAELNWQAFPGFTEKSAMVLLRYPWPGNVRELKNVVERSLFRWDDESEPVDEVILDPFQNPYPDFPVQQALTTAEPEQPASQALADIMPLKIGDFSDSVANFEKRLLKEALAANNYHQGDTASALGLSYNQMRGLVRKYQLSTARERVLA
jgi:psp operon transcriptional activator